MSLVPPIKDGDFTSVRQAIQKLASNLRLGYESIPTFGGADITGNIAIGGNSAVTGNETVGGTLGVTGLSTLGDVSMSGSLTLSGLTEGRIPYIGATDILTDSANLLWDNTNQIFRADGVICSIGTTGATPVSGAGTRLMWIPAKKAFRVGAVTGTEWDDANIGTYTTVFGNNSKVEGNLNFVYGNDNWIEIGCEDTFIFGNNNHALDTSYIFMMGTSLVSQKSYTYIFGYTLTALGNYQSLFGRSFTPLNADDNFCLGWGQLDYSFTATAADFKDSSIATTSYIQSLNIQMGAAEGRLESINATDLQIYSASGAISFNDDNLLTTGTLGCGVITTVTGLKILEESGDPALYGILRVPGLSTNDKTYTFPSVTTSLAHSVLGTYAPIDDYIDQAVKTTSSPTFASPYFTGTLGIGIAPATTAGIYLSKTLVGSTITGLYGGVTNSTYTSPVISGISGLNFNVNFIPSANFSFVPATFTLSAMSGCLAPIKVETYANETKNATVAAISGFYPNPITITRGAGSSGTLTVTNLYEFRTSNPAVSGSSVITTLYGFYDGGLTNGATNWGLAINTQSYINANLRIGSAVAPTVALDVTGKGLFTDDLGINADSKKFLLGALATGDLQLYHDGTNSYIYNDTGILKIQDAGSGINLGTAITELLGFYGVTPVDQPATVADAATQDIAGTDTVDEVKIEADLTSCKNAINAIIDRLIELGLISAT